ncbi:MAG: triose-phosphate isomerase [bacterium]|nr:triose-phosphate isomerase [bacterium]
MGKKKIVIANWKMSLTLRESIQLAKEVSAESANVKNVDVVLCPSFTALPSVGPLLPQTVALGAQDVFWEEKGAYTGAIAPRLLTEMGCRYVLIGHSERRQYFQETDAMVNKKVLAALRAGLIPVLCVGENNDERRNGQKDYVVMRQVAEAIRGVTLLGTQELIVAYEPVWVIGTGQAVSGDDAEHMSQVIRHTITDIIPPVTMESRCRVLYGGSVDAKNVADFTHRNVIDGVLVGGSSLKSSSFFGILSRVR